ncbi:hypothetical protein [Anaeromicropila populeti]|uniref:Uncharacterized protein n=1 Tax=Anaeromicropila populeti TaxID=37658 RepID=A0A1I6ISX9_9FIRM|nr:hypothetical protein [Anaeromicropila populeti]SFR69842.1 hypothetical protein SAMN05661086_01149 [Anaeromicropila populeti]
MLNYRYGSNNVIYVRDALIEEVFHDRNAGYVTISYGEIGNFNIVHIRVVQLLVGQTTIIQNRSGQSLLLRDLRKGMTVDAVFSNLMTASEPPQARAFEIIVWNEETHSNTVVDRVITVNTENHFFITGKANLPEKQIRFNVNPQTVLLDQRGNRICLCRIRAGQMVKVTHADFMTFSIPPQTTAYRVQIV